MLVLTRRLNQSIKIGDDVEITVIEVRGDQVRLGVSAPRDVAVHRKEVYLQIQQENRAASAAPDASSLDMLGDAITKQEKSNSISQTNARSNLERVFTVSEASEVYQCRQSPPQKKPVSHLDTPTEGPSIFFDASALSLLRGDVTVLTRFLQFMSQDVLQEHIPASKIEVRGSVDPEDDTSQILVRVWIRELSDSDIRRYYHDFGGRVDNWTAYLPEEQKLYFFSRISFQARRDTDA